MWDGQKMRKPARLLCELTYGPPPSPEYDAAHHCDNRRCLNKKHLHWASKQENIAERDQRGRTYQPKGKLHPAAKLTEQQVLEIRASDMPLGEIATAFGISKSHACGIRKRTKWPHV
jgi:hypothetical protein